MINRPFIRVPDNSHVELQCPSIPSLWSEQLQTMLTRPYGVTNLDNSIAHSVQEVKDVVPREAKSVIQSPTEQKPQPIIENVFAQGETAAGQSNITNSDIQTSTNNHGNSELSKSEHVLAKDQSSRFQTEGQLNEQEPPVKPIHPHDMMNDFTITNQNNDTVPFQPSPCIIQNQQTDPSLVDFHSYPNPGSCSLLKTPEQSYTLSEAAYSVLPSVGQELWDTHFSSAKTISQANLPVLLPHQDMSNVQYNSCGLKQLSNENHNQSDIYSCLNLDGSNSGSTVIDPSVSSTILDDICTLRNVDYTNPCDYLVGSTQDVQSAGLADTRNFSMQEYADNSGGASSSNVDFDDNNFLQQNSFHQLPPRFRTYTKVN